ncbi:short-chain dehydrogenase [Xaviernesmea oryzae]|uniref:Short-chain dehydrogenase n=1 Tax=Xaviernesmea oryzae TaxID=464029 RepID=A0A1Q9AUI2_9HYPH|nr:SDR family oxidoreductase [Xaviernesmea oryzae]OLP59107.1 short-chain dehydrogenase [Xaviernesmea oryzae]SEK86346.1 Short-chain dehydrogenase [Xaviernesmea oryzae]
MMRSLKDAVVVIVGASSGIGEATAEEFAAEGARLVLAARNGPALEAIAERCRRKGVRVLVVPTDVTEPRQITALAGTAHSFGRIDVWVSNVGVGAVGRFQDVPFEAHEKIIRANLLSHMQEAHAVLPVFLEQGHGTFINMISLGGFAATPFAAAYAASKFGLRGFAQSLRAELSAHRDIHICDIYPAFVDTPGLKHGANYVGRAIKPPPPVIDARRVARAIVHAARSPRATTTVGAVTNATRLIVAIAPNLAASMLAKGMERAFRRAERVDRSEGNLHRASLEPGGIDGGFRQPGLMRSPSGAVLAGVAVAGLALVAGRLLAGGRASARHRSLRHF